MPENYHHLHFEVVGSTNDLCRIECKKKLKPTLITADKQTDGRGRNQKKWESPKGNISFSYGLFCEKPHPALSFIFLPAMYGVNFLLDTNYWYILEKPAGDNIMNFMPEAPMHIVALIPVAWLLTYLLYVPYQLKDKNA